MKALCILVDSRRHTLFGIWKLISSNINSHIISSKLVGIRYFENTVLNLNERKGLQKRTITLCKIVGLAVYGRGAC
nr:CIH_HP1_G0018310.mRNA.1.CDS.1 [Saccharomyces cerevisiae]